MSRRTAASNFALALLLLASTAGLCRRAIGVRAASVERLKGEGRYALVPGLYLQITASGARSWLLRFELNGKERMMGLGSAAIFTLAQTQPAASKRSRGN
jgi:hypothetical protein